MYVYVTVGRRQRALDPPASPAGSGGEPAPDAARFEAEHAAWRARLDKAMEGSYSITHGRMLREAFEEGDPEPQLHGQPSDAPAVETWWCVDGGAGAGIPETWLCPGDRPFPRAELADALTRFEELGWSVEHVSEDREVHHEEDVSRAVVAGSAILLRRP